jgi:hypothetical protein
MSAASNRYRQHCRSDRAGNRERCRVRWPARSTWTVTVTTEAGAGTMKLRAKAR